jgi:hypothetical protein
MLATFFAMGQVKKYDLQSLLKSKKLAIVNRTVSSIADNKKAVKFDERSDEGVAWLQGVTFSSGTIEIDLRGQDVLQKSFVGIAFHGVNDSTFEAVYFRPFNFHAKDTVRKIHAVQYISHPVYTWRKLRDERNGIFEKGLIVPAPDPNGWFHARIEVLKDVVRVFVDDDAEPSLTVNRLNDRKSGTLGLWVGDGSGGEFANLSIKQN